MLADTGFQYGGPQNSLSESTHDILDITGTDDHENSLEKKGRLVRMEMGRTSKERSAQIRAGATHGAGRHDFREHSTCTKSKIIADHPHLMGQSPHHFTRLRVAVWNSTKGSSAEDVMFFLIKIHPANNARRAQTHIFPEKWTRVWRSSI